MVFSKTSMVWISRWIYLRSEPYCLLISRIISRLIDYLPLVSENPSPLPFLEKKNLLGGDIHPLPPKSFLQSTSTSLLIINPLHSRVAHRSFDSPPYHKIPKQQNSNQNKILFPPLARYLAQLSHAFFKFILPKIYYRGSHILQAAIVCSS